MSAYEWLLKNIDLLEIAVINQCDFCIDKNQSKKFFPLPLVLNKDVIKKPNNKMVKGRKDKIEKLRLLGEYINHYEFLILEEMLINKRAGKDIYKWQQLLDRVELSRKIIDKESSSIRYELDFKTHKSIDTLSKVSFIFLPLSFIVGYFGMNFTSMGIMGHNVNKNGILMWKYGHKFVFSLIFVTIILTSIYLYYFQETDINIDNAIDDLSDMQTSAADDLS